MNRIFPTVAAIAATFAPAWAADPGAPPPTVPPSPSTIWNGFYAGGHAGYAFANSNFTATPATPAFGTVGLPSSDKQFGPVSAGFQIGYNHVFPNGIFTGFEASLTFPDIMQATFPLGATPGGPTTISDAVEIYGGLRARAGYAFDNWLVYGTAGFAYDRDHINDTLGDSVYFWRTGWTAGLGTEVRLTSVWSAKLEYSYDDFGHTSIGLPAAGIGYRSSLPLQTVELGLNYRFGDTPGDPTIGGGIVSNLDQWSLHGQTTMIAQYAAPFHAPVSGPQSLFPGGQVVDTWSVTGYFGYKPWEGTELYYNPEPFQGFGLSQTHGLAGFPNGEAQKAGFDYPHYNTARAFVRETFGLGGEQEDLEDGQNQVASKVDVSRVTVTAGKFAIPDIFDNNTYAHDARSGFMNWSIWEGGAFDYAADQKGYTWGLAVELNQKNWAVRTGYFLEPDVPNGNDFDTRIGQRGQYVGELEERYLLFSQPGKLRLTGWVAECFCGNFNDTLANPLLNPLTAPATSPGIAATRQTRTEFGFIGNLEQAITDDFGVFSRLSWQNGQTEIMAWTDIDESWSFGGVMKGTSWGRPDDKIGVAGVVNGLSSAYRAYLAAGGLGINIGDGSLTNYAPEGIIEVYYSIALAKATALTFDYQFVANPAYNADRGPVSIGSVRFHTEF